MSLMEAVAQCIMVDRVNSLVLLLQVFVERPLNVLLSPTISHMPFPMLPSPPSF